MTKTLAVFTAAICLPGMAHAAGGITYDCDTAANHYSELVLPAPSRSFTVSGNVQLNALAEVTKYTPLARVQISSATQPGQSPGSYAGISVEALPVDGRKTPSGKPAIQMVLFNASGREDEVVPLSLLDAPGGVQSFSLTFDGSKVSASIGREHRAFSMQAAAPVVRIVCSTGEFLFTNLSIEPSK